ncbi:MAG: SDR family NAD(P)-dependent oxidoreductase, partial [Actinomycetota bacterium]|nr:SDR family NAD(P)-dependent oxidoreductase [Actinomycetota bacterium]
MQRPGTDATQVLDGKVVAITGGARGIGQATARRLAAMGARLAIGDLDAEAASSTATSLGESHLGMGLDVTDRDSFEEFISRTERELGPVDILVNNAGVMFISRLDEQDEDAIDTTLAVNLQGVITGTRLAVQRMRPRGRGLIVNIASQAGKAGLVGGSVYAATKFGVVGL